MAAPQQRPDAQQHLRHVHRLDHVIIRARVEAVLLVRDRFLCGDHQYGNVVSAVAKLPRQLIAVQIRHHHVGDQQMDRLLQEQIQRLLAVLGFQHMVARLRQMQGHQLSQVFMVVRDQNRNHFLFHPLCALSYQRRVNAM